MTDNKRRKIEQTIDENIILDWFENEYSKGDNFVEDSDSEKDFIIRSDLVTDSEEEANSFDLDNESR